MEENKYVEREREREIIKIKRLTIFQHDGVDWWIGVERDSMGCGDDDYASSSFKVACPITLEGDVLATMEMFLKWRSIYWQFCWKKLDFANIGNALNGIPNI